MNGTGGPSKGRNLYSTLCVRDSWSWRGTRSLGCCITEHLFRETYYSTLVELRRQTVRMTSDWGEAKICKESDRR
jgi:hypothetical protein